MRLLLRCLTAMAVAASVLAGPAATARASAAEATALKPVADSAACLAVLATHPQLNSLEAAEAFSTTGPCAPASSSSASLALATVSCSATGAGHEDYAIISGLLYGFYSSLFMLGCADNAGRPATAICVAGNVAPGALPVNAIAAAGSGGCDAVTITSTSLPGTAVYWGVGLAVSTSGGVYTTGLRFGLHTIS